MEEMPYNGKSTSNPKQSSFASPNFSVLIESASVVSGSSKMYFYQFLVRNKF